MKNIITPEVLATLKEGPLSMEKIVNFLDKNPEITTSNLSKPYTIVGIEVMATTISAPMNIGFFT